MITENEKGLVFKINHPTGYVEVTLDGFFPCPVRQGRKLFKMARKYCSRAEQLELHNELCALYDQYPGKIKAAAAELGNSDLCSCDFETMITKLRLLRRDWAGLALNIRDAVGILGVKECTT